MEKSTIEVSTTTNQFISNFEEENVFVFPLSFSQERLWLLEQLTNNQNLYSTVICIQLQGQVQISALKQAITKLVERNEILRTTFPMVNGTPMQVILPSLPIDFSMVDLQALSEKEQLAEIKHLVIREENLAFDLEKGPLLRPSLLKLGEESIVLLIAMHHIIYDGWSMDIFLKDLSILYQNYSSSKSLPLPELPIQYADFAEWQRQYFEGETLAKGLDYWQEKLKGAPPMIELPIDHPRPTIPSFRGAQHSLVLSPTFLSSVKQFSNRHRVTLFTCLLATLKILLFRWTGQTDLVVGTVTSGRNRAEIRDLFGCFMNFLALRSQIRTKETAKEFLQQVGDSVLDAYAHEDCPFEKVVQALNPDRNLSRNSLYNVALLLQNFSLDLSFGENIRVKPIEFKSNKSVLDLRIVACEKPKGLEVLFEYSQDLFEAETIERMANHFQKLLEAIVANPEQPISQLPLLTEESERHQLLVEWNETSADYPQDKCVYQLFEEQVERTPDAIAVVFEEQQLTYRELNEKANQLAHYLHKLGIQPDDLMGICIERSLEMVIGLLGILKSGGAYVPIDPHYPSDRIDYMLEDSQTKILLTQTALISQLPEYQGEVIDLEGDWGTIAEARVENPSIEINSDNLAYVIYTSGSTGKPKGAMNAHRGVVNRLLWMQSQYGLNQQDTVLQKTPFSFDVSGWEFFWTLITGAKLIVAKPEGHKDSDYLVEKIITEKITTIHFVPSMLQVFLENDRVQQCQSLKRVVCSGEAMSYDLQQRFFQKLSCELHNLYGPTEAAIDVSYWACQADHPLQKVPIGRPVSNTQLYILDGQGQPVPIGVAGELHIGGVQVGKGYLNRPELTAEKFIPNPFSDEQGARLYKTGDLCRFLPDGNIEYLSRLDHQVKIRGFRIELEEIVNVLGQHPAVQQNVVVAKEDLPDQKRLVAYVIPNSVYQDSLEQQIGVELSKEQVSQGEVLHEQTYSKTTENQKGEFNIVGGNSSYTNNPLAKIVKQKILSELRRFLSQKLPDYMVPASFVFLDEFPLTPNGKLDRKALPIPDQTRPELESDFVAPRNTVEENLATIWSEMLALERIGIHDNFFELGGHSLLATQVISRLRNTWPIDFKLISFFEQPTIAQIAEQIDQILLTAKLNKPVDTLTDREEIEL